MRVRRSALQKEYLKFVYSLALSARKRGRLVPEPCLVCGNTPVDGHHISYWPEDLLDLIWLCDKHHGEIHGHTTPLFPDDRTIRECLDAVNSWDERGFAAYNEERTRMERKILSAIAHSKTRIEWVKQVAKRSGHTVNQVNYILRKYKLFTNPKPLGTHL